MCILFLDKPKIKLTKKYAYQRDSCYDKTINELILRFPKL